MKQEVNRQYTSARSGATLWRNPIRTDVLWIVQGAMALFFLYGGAIKLVPPDSAPGAALLASLLSPLPNWFVDFTGITEILGALGLVFPMLLRILPILTPLAAVGLLIEMIGATVFVIHFYALALAALPVMTGLILAFIAYECWLRLKTHN
jgi:uncharacterized membrane protein YphA (DoxX/SURF4 family)